MPTNTTPSLDHEIITTRVVNAPRARVFTAWTDPTHLARWWGPNGFTNTFHGFDLRPGGNWRFTMHGPTGANYPNHSVFVEIAEPERIVFDHLSDHWFRIVATFDDLGEKTSVTFRMQFKTAKKRDRIAKFAVEKNEENLDRLETELERMT